MRILVAGQRAFGAAAYARCRALGHAVVAVAAPAEAATPASDGTPRPDRLRAAAEADGVPWLPPGQLRAAQVPDDTDLILAAHSHDVIGRATRLRTRFGAIGYHPSLLPLHRGRDAVRWAVHMGERVTGGTVFWLTDQVDAGDIAAQAFCFIQPGETATGLWRRALFPLGLELLTRVLRDLAAGRVVRIPQDPQLATWEPGWDRPPLGRPELPLLGDGRPHRYQVAAEAAGQL